MKLFVDTADTAGIKSLAAGGLLDGVAGSPSLVAKTGKKFTDIMREIFVVVLGPVA
jgi:transaldolase